MHTVHKHTVRLAPSSRAGLFPLVVLGLATLAAAPPASAQTHVYTLNNTYADANGGPSLVPNGGTLSASGYTFGQNQGLSLSGALASGSNYSIETLFTFSSLPGARGYNKILDFKNLGNDNGLYDFNGFLQFFQGGSFATSSTALIPAGTPVDLLVTRNGGTGLFTASINGVQQFSFLDTQSQAVFDSPNNIIQFFRDDTVTSGQESAPGTVTRITINAAPVPEASTTVSLGLLLALGLGGLVVGARRRKANSTL